MIESVSKEFGIKLFMDEISKNKRKTINRNINSYNLKHRLEEFLKYELNISGDYYISNDEMIELMNEYNFHKTTSRNHNPFFNVRSLKELTISSSILQY